MIRALRQLIPHFQSFTSAATTIAMDNKVAAERGGFGAEVNNRRQIMSGEYKGTATCLLEGKAQARAAFL